MEKNKEKINISFFKKVWYSITNFEQYPAMATEGLPKAIKYLVIITAIVTIFAMTGSVLQMNKLVGNLSQYIEQNIPDFTYEDGNILMEEKNPIIIENVEYSGINKIVVHPEIENNEQKEQAEKDEAVTGITIFFFKNEIVLEGKKDDANIEIQKYTYNEFLSNYTKKEITNFNKAELVEYLKSKEMVNFYAQYAVTAFVSLLITGIIYALLNTLRVAILGWVTAGIARIKIKFVSIYNMAIYAFTLPSILNIIYLIINYFTKFTIKYFDIAYTAIAYIYLAAAIFILKDDFIKRMQEVVKIKQEQKNVREEIKEQDKNKEEPDGKKDSNDKKEEGEEKREEPEGPEGSEA